MRSPKVDIHRFYHTAPRKERRMYVCMYIPIEPFSHLAAGISTRKSRETLRHRLFLSKKKPREDEDMRATKVKQP